MHIEFYDCLRDQCAVMGGTQKFCNHCCATGLSGLFTWALAYSASPLAWTTAAANTPLRYAVPKDGLQGMEVV